MTTARAEEFELVTWGRGGRFTRCDIDRISAFVEAEDVERYAQRVRPHGGVGDAETAAATAPTVRR